MPLSREEELTLLSEAAEYRRLKALESEAAMRSPDLTPPRVSVLANEAGYDDDIEDYEDAYDRGLKAREVLVTRNMGLVHYVVNEVMGTKSKAKGFTGKRRLNSLSVDDLLQEGSIGLSRAVEKYVLSKSNGARFSTYAVYWIRAAVLRCIAEKDDVIRVPVGVTEAISKMTRAAGALGIELDGIGIAGAIESAHDAIGVDLTKVDGSGGARTKAWKEAEAAKALAAQAGISDNMLREAMRVRRRRNTGGYTSFNDSWMLHTGDPITNGKTAISTAAASSGEEDMEELKRALGEFLQPRELEALSWRYGLLQEFDGYRDYEAEALEDIFGEGGLFASSTLVSKKASPVPVKTGSAVAAAAGNAIPQGGKWGEAMSFAEVGKNMAVSAEYGRRLCRRALDKLKKAADEGHLELQPEWLV